VQAKGERCYHVFYQLCAGADPAMRKAMGLQQAEAYRYLAHGQAIQIEGMDDAKEFRELCTCLTAVGISAADQQQVRENPNAEPSVQLTQHVFYSLIRRSK
jgi:myosin-5